MQPANVLLLISIGLCSGMSAGCAGQHAELALPPAPVVLNLPDCPAPVRPVLPTINGDAPFDSTDNVATLLLRDDVWRRYMQGLEETILCYRRCKGVPDAH